MVRHVSGNRWPASDSFGSGPFRVWPKLPVGCRDRPGSHKLKKERTVKKLFCNPRFLLTVFALLGFCLLLGIIVLSPAQGSVIGYKLALVVLAAIVGMAFDYLAFPYALPSGYLDRDWRNTPNADGGDGKPDYPVAEGYIMPFCATLTRRAVIIFGFIIAVAVGL